MLSSVYLFGFNESTDDFFLFGGGRNGRRSVQFESEEDKLQIPSYERGNFMKRSWLGKNNVTSLQAEGSISMGILTRTSSNQTHFEKIMCMCSVGWEFIECAVTSGFNVEDISAVSFLPFKAIMKWDHWPK